MTSAQTACLLLLGAQFPIVAGCGGDRAERPIAGVVYAYPGGTERVQSVVIAPGVEVDVQDAPGTAGMTLDILPMTLVFQTDKTFVLREQQKDGIEMVTGGRWAEEGDVIVLHFSSYMLMPGEAEESASRGQVRVRGDRLVYHRDQRELEFTRQEGTPPPKSATPTVAPEDPSGEAATSPLYDEVYRANRALQECLFAAGDDKQKKQACVSEFEARMKKAVEAVRAAKEK